MRKFKVGDKVKWGGCVGKVIDVKDVNDPTYPYPVTVLFASQIKSFTSDGVRDLQFPLLPKLEHAPNLRRFRREIFCLKDGTMMQSSVYIDISKPPHDSHIRFIGAILDENGNVVKDE